MAQVNYTTREGFVAVIRRVIHFFNPLPNLDRADVLMTLYVNGGAVNDQINIPVGVEQSDLVNCFIVVDELQEFRVGVECVGGDPDADFVVQVYGNYILKTEVPPNFQIASCVGKGPGQGIAMPAPQVIAPQARAKPPGYQAAPTYRPQVPMTVKPPVPRAPPPRPPLTPPPAPPPPPRAGVLRSGRNK